MISQPDINQRPPDHLKGGSEVFRQNNGWILQVIDEILT